MGLRVAIRFFELLLGYYPRITTVTKTLGPLHFDDLEPKRFKDLARQLVYDFRIWRRLEATGRAGSDDGFDARGYQSSAATQQGQTKGGKASPWRPLRGGLWASLIPTVCRLVHSLTAAPR